MRGLALCLVVGAIAVVGCGSDCTSSSTAPAQANVASSGGTTGATAGVSAKGRATPESLCASEGKGKPKKQCTAGLTKLDKGKVANPRAACKGLSKKKIKGVRGKSPYAVCIKAAAKLMAAKAATGGTGNGAADSGGDGSSSDTNADDSGSDSAGGDSADPVCRDANGNTVPSESEDVDECDLPANADDSSDSSGADDSSSADDPSDDSQ